MAKTPVSTTETQFYPGSQDEAQVFNEVKRHSDLGFNETDNRTTGRGRIGSISFNEADELFRSWIDENNWPYDALLFDPRVFTFITEKTSRLISSKPKGRLTPREGSDVLKAKIVNAVLDYQWDMANHGGSMITKYAMLDMNARKYGAGFALCKWRYETDRKGKVVFDGPDMTVINNRDFAHDLSANSIENCNWVQVRSYTTIQELERVNDASRGRPVYRNLERLKSAVSDMASPGNGGDRSSSNWMSRNRQISRLDTDPTGRDESFPVVEIVTEYRRDRWITFAPKHGIVLRDIANPYDNNEIPVIMLRYYAIDDDLYGLSEIEPVKGLQKAINALVSQYVDEINQNLYSPIAIGPGVRQHTLEWGKGARWVMNNPMQDFRIVEGKSNAAAYFNQTYSVLVAAMMNALGESSLGISNIQPMQNDKTATEVKALTLQRNARDNYNQIFLGEMIKRQYMLWHSMNQKMLFADKSRIPYIVRIVGMDALETFKQSQLHEQQLDDMAVQAMIELKTTDYTNFLTPKYPIKVDNEWKSKMELEDNGKSGLLYVEPDDINGLYDFSIDVESMSSNADDMRRDGRSQALNLLVSNPNVMAMLQQDGVKPKFKDLFVSWLEDLGFQDAERFFENGAPGGMPPQGGEPPAGQPSPQAGPGPEMGGMPPVDQMLPANQGVVNPQIASNQPINQTLGKPNARALAEMLTGGANGV
jgi:hypothetical protein